MKNTDMRRKMKKKRKFAGCVLCVGCRPTPWMLDVAKAVTDHFSREMIAICKEHNPKSSEPFV
jgi:hypothetical protein